MDKRESPTSTQSSAIAQKKRIRKKAGIPEAIRMAIRTGFGGGGRPQFNQKRDDSEHTL
jgi:hypothetical protein